MMEGLVKEWNYIGNRRYVTYSSVSPGHYTFRVKASNNDGAWNEEGTSLRITIVPPYWRTLWFYIICSIIILIIAGKAYQNHIKRVQREKEEDERRKVTDDFNQVLEESAAVVYRRNFDSDAYEYIGDGIKYITGYSKEEFTLKTWDTIVLRTQASGKNAYRTLEEIIENV
jgi:hypothetical protein